MSHIADMFLEPDADPRTDLELAEGAPEELVARLEAEMRREARALRFENAASLRDRIRELRMRR